MKKCFKCEVEKEFFEFGKYKKSKDGLYHLCKLCKREMDKFYYNRKDKLKKEDKYLKQVKRIKNIKEYVLDYMKDKKCKNCNENRLPALDFHHLNNKEFNVSQGILNGYSLDRIKKEINKCEILCSNCHRVETADQFNWYCK